MTISFKEYIHIISLYYCHIFNLTLSCALHWSHTTLVATLCEQKIWVAHPTLSLSAEDTRRPQQNPTGDPHLSDLSSLSSCYHGPRRHRRAPGASSPSPRWEHVARRPHTPGKSPGCCWSCASDCSSVVMRVSDWGVWRELTPSESTRHADRHALVWKACGQVPHEQGGVSPIEFAWLSSVRDGILTSSSYCSELPRNVSDSDEWNKKQEIRGDGDCTLVSKFRWWLYDSLCSKRNVSVIYLSTD